MVLWILKKTTYLGMSITRVSYTFLTTERYISLTGWKYKTTVTVALGITKRIRQTVYKSILNSRAESIRRAACSLLGWSKRYMTYCMISIKKSSINFLEKMVNEVSKSLFRSLRWNVNLLIESSTSTHKTVHSF